MSLAASDSVDFKVEEPAQETLPPVQQIYSRRTAISESLINPKYPLKSVGVPTTHVIQDVVFYEVEAYNRQYRWNVYKRFEQFSQLYTDLTLIANKIGDAFTFPPFPSRQLKLLVDHLDKNFVEQRRVLLDNFLQRLVPFADITESRAFISFLVPEDDDPFVPPSHPPKAPPESELQQEALSPDDSLLRARSVAEAAAGASSSVSDTREVTGIAIPAAQVLQSEHVVYQINVTNLKRRRSFQQWTLLKRYSDFADFDYKLRQEFYYNADVLNQLPALPPKYSAWLYNHLDPDFIEHRRVLLEAYLQKLIAVPALFKNALMLEFMGV